MYLREIRVEKIDNTNMVCSSLPFRLTAHHVKEIFIALLPSKYTLDGSSLFQITCGSSEGKPIYNRLPSFGCSEYFVEDFDFDSYYKYSQSEQEEIILDMIESVLLQIAEENNSDVEVIKKNVRDVKDSNFYIKIKIQKLCKRHPTSKMRVNINRILSKEDGESWSLEVYDGNNLVHEEYITKRPSYVDNRGTFFKSQWRGDIFYITDHIGIRESYKFDMSPFCQQQL
jgi:hypothetical protein